MSEFPKMRQITSPQGSTQTTKPGFDPLTRRLLLNLDARMRLLENEAITVGKKRKEGYLLLEDRVQELRAKWGELISNV